MATADPSVLFLTAALAAGIVEGSSVIRYHRRHARTLLHPSSEEDNDDAGNNKRSRSNDEGDDTSASSTNNDNTHNDYDDATTMVLPSRQPVLQLAAHSFLYGVASVPLGIVGGSPGHVLLPRFIEHAAASSSTEVINDGDNTDPASASEEYATNDAEKMRAVKEELVNHRHDTLDDFRTVVAGTGRDAGRMLRHENSRKMMILHNKRLLRRRPRRSSSLHIATRNKLFAPSNRFVATLDGVPLPTPLAEAMRRSRCAFVSAGIVSFALTRYYCFESSDNYRSSSSRNQHDNNVIIRMAQDDSGCHRLDTTNYSNSNFGGRHVYDHWITNGECIAFWNERIRNGRGSSIDEFELLKRLRNDRMARQHDASVSDIREIITSRMMVLSKTSVLYHMQIRNAMFDGMYDATKWINSRLDRELHMPPFGWIRHWKTEEATNTNVSDAAAIDVSGSTPEADARGEDPAVVGGNDSDNLEAAADDELQIVTSDDDTTNTTPLESSSFVSSSDSRELLMESQSSQNAVWKAAVTSVDVLGTSIRHLLVSTYGLASTVVATVGRKGRGRATTVVEDDDDALRRPSGQTVHSNAATANDKEESNE